MTDTAGISRTEDESEFFGLLTRPVPPRTPYLQEVKLGQVSTQACGMEEWVCSASQTF